MLRLLVISGILLLSGRAFAQPADSLSEAATVSLLTMLPGDEVYSQFGHSGYRIHDPLTGLDKTYNFGTFDFEQPFFVFRFVRGELDYVLDTAPYELELDKYAYLRRPMIEQQLALPHETVQFLYSLLETNALAENRAYRYDFFFDNCSTRLLDILDDALEASGHERLSLPSETATESFRELIAPYITDTPFLRLGINLGLGMPADAIATPRQRSFLPMELMNQFDGASFNGQPLIATTDTVVVVPDYSGERTAVDWPKLALWLVFLGGVGMTLLGLRTNRKASPIGRRGDWLLFSVLGFVGLILTVLWFGTEHAVTGPNLNLLWAWPTHLFVARWMRKPTLPRWMKVYLGASVLVTIVTLILWRFLPQALPSSAIPLLLLIVIRSFVRSYPSVQTSNIPR